VARVYSRTWLKGTWDVNAFRFCSDLVKYINAICSRICIWWSYCYLPCLRNDIQEYSYYLCLKYQYKCVPWCLAPEDSG
jgi:hypothetical protein